MSVAVTVWRKHQRTRICWRQLITGNRLTKGEITCTGGGSVSCLAGMLLACPLQGKPIGNMLTTDKVTGQKQYDPVFRMGGGGGYKNDKRAYMKRRSVGLHWIILMIIAPWKQEIPNMWAISPAACSASQELNHYTMHRYSLKQGRMRSGGQYMFALPIWTRQIIP